MQRNVEPASLDGDCRPLPPLRKETEHDNLQANGNATMSDLDRMRETAEFIYWQDRFEDGSAEETMSKLDELVKNLCDTDHCSSREDETEMIADFKASIVAYIEERFGSLVAAAQCFCFEIPSGVPDDEIIGNISNVNVYAGEVRRLRAALAKAGE